MLLSNGNPQMVASSFVQKVFLPPSLFGSTLEPAGSFIPTTPNHGGYNFDGSGSVNSGTPAVVQINDEPGNKNLEERLDRTEKILKNMS
jgi:hypothetical protein